VQQAIAGQIHQQRGYSLERNTVVDPNVTRRVQWHRRKGCLFRILHDRNAAQLLDRPQSRGPVVEIAGQDDADGGWPEDLRGRNETADRSRFRA
jgi:hypothetical protein